MERVLPSRDIRKRIAGFAVGLAADCDRPESSVERIIRANLRGASTLPFVGFVTHDEQWVEGYSGSKGPYDFLAVVEKAEATPHLQATKAVRKKLATLVTLANKAAARSDWKRVLKTGQSADKTIGRCPERVAIAGIVQKARTWAAGQLEAAVETAQSGGDLDAATASLALVRKHFSREPEGADANTGIKALRRLARIREAEAGDQPPPAGTREKAAADFKKTRWKKVFAKE